MSDNELKSVEQLVNQKIRENVSLIERREVPISEAKEMGAMALFGEKYGDKVRVITFDSAYSVELCGGTHVKATGEIGLFKLKSESAVAAGVRRIEAISSLAAENMIADQEKMINEIKAILKSNDPIKSIETLIYEKSDLQKKLDNYENERTQQIKNQLLNELVKEAGVSRIIAKVNVSNTDQLKNLSFQLKQEVPQLFCLLVMENNQKPFISLILSEELVESKQWNAGSLVKTWAKHIQGGGGGQAFYATAGGNNLSGLESVLKEAEIWIEGNC